MHIKSFILASVACIAMTSSSFAICYEDTQDVPDIVVNVKGGYAVQPSGGPQDGWSGHTFGGCKIEGSDRIWQLPNTGNGVCLTPASIVGQGPASLKKLPDTTKIEVTPDLDVYRIGFWLPRPGPDKWIGTDWTPGYCPF